MCAAIRDAQLEEKKALQRQQEEEEMYLDAQMEEERARAVELYEQREQQRLVDRVHGKEEMKKEAAKKLMEEVAESNAQMTRLKELKRIREKEEDARIAQYLKDKAKREQEHQEMLDKAAAEKE